MNCGKKEVAYFSMEFGLNSDFKIYAGGLGILAGDFLKSAHDANLPVIGIGIKWKQGYVDQHLNEAGEIVDSYYNNNYDFLQDTGVKVSVKIRNRDVYCKVWKVDCFNNAELYLLDTDLPENSDRFITGQLYGWFEEERIAQEIILGIGGVKAIRALNKNIDIFHFNEGHALFAAFELIQEKVRYGIPMEEAVRLTREQVVFTTHTPVMEGNEVHSLSILDYMGAFNGIPSDIIKSFGGDPFNMTAAALRLSKKSNAVSNLHREVAEKMWQHIENRSSIIGITNGVHIGTWGDPEVIKSFDNSEALFAAHMKNKVKLIDYLFQETGVKLDKDKLLIGFARRAAPYKRGDLLFYDESRIAPLLKEGKIQLVFSSKAHPMDFTGKDIIKRINSLKDKYPNSVVFLQNYNMDKGAMLTRGADVWLNNPRVTKEACGTSGMKAAINGVLNLSTLDGWWPEACWDEVTGWQIGNGFVSDNNEEQDRNDALSLYKVLEEKVLPTYYNNKAKWIDMMNASIKGIVYRFSGERMVKEYYEKLYK